MLHIVWGSDREATRDAAQKLLKATLSPVLVVTDSHSVDDLRFSMQGVGLFGETSSVFLDGVLATEEMKRIILSSLNYLKKSPQLFVLRDEKIDADTRKQLEKYAEKSEKFELKKEKEVTTVFALANALQKRDKKALWVGLQREFLHGNAPEAVHGVLFWAAKQEFLKTNTERARAQVALLAELPHEARRKGIELEYALERFALSQV